MAPQIVPIIALAANAVLMKKGPKPLFSIPFEIVREGRLNDGGIEVTPPLKISLLHKAQLVIRGWA